MQPPHLSMLRQLPVTFCFPIPTKLLDLLFRSEYICLQSLSILPLLGNGLRLCTSLNIISFKHLATEIKLFQHQKQFSHATNLLKMESQIKSMAKMVSTLSGQQHVFCLACSIAPISSNTSRSNSYQFAPIIQCKILHLFFHNRNTTLYLF